MYFNLTIQSYYYLSDFQSILLILSKYTNFLLRNLSKYTNFQPVIMSKNTDFLSGYRIILHCSAHRPYDTLCRS